MNKVTLKEVEQLYREAVNSQTGTKVESVQIGTISRAILKAVVDKQNEIIDKVNSILEMFPKSEEEKANDLNSLIFRTPLEKEEIE